MFDVMLLLFIIYLHEIEIAEGGREGAREGGREGGRQRSNFYSYLHLLHSFSFIAYSHPSVTHRMALGKDRRLGRGCC